MIHFFHLGSQLWFKDWYSYKKPGTRVKVWVKIQDAAFTPSRIGELLESSCRPGTGRGLHYKVSDLSQGEAFQLIRHDLGHDFRRLSKRARNAGIRHISRKGRERHDEHPRRKVS